MTNSIEPQTIKAAFKQLGKSVCILSCFAQGQPHATVSTAVCNVSNSPPTLLVCMEETASFSALLDHGSEFAVNILSSTQRAIVDLCMQRKGVHRLVHPDWQLAGELTPLLNNTQANLLCRVREMSTVETHRVVIADVIQVSSDDNTSALIYVGGDFHAVST
jgi:flavin reductase (DIM6/NTAB) family NADH-FMN oxidoreductase RutF